jgi:alpha-1,2-mannosyltransferase
MTNKTQDNFNINNHKITLNFTYLYLLFATINLIAAKYNHIDDTDETYGYFEPLHYLLTNQGFQTWEYSPNFGIRSYAYLSPFWLLSTIFIKFTSLLFGGYYIASNKIILFYYIKIILGLFTAYSETKFITSIEKRCGKLSSYMTCILIISSPGIFYSSTSFLPSASAMSLFMLATSAYLDNSFIISVFWGCICVCWLGWPFVAVLFVPLGIHMLIVEYNSPKYNHNSLISVIYLILQVILVFIIVTLPSYFIDCYLYDNWYYKHFIINY